MSVRVCVVALPTVLASAVCGPVDVLGTANILAKRPVFSVSVRTPGTGGVVSSSGLVLGARAGLPRVQQNVVIVSGFGVTRLHDAADTVVARVREQTRLAAWLRRQAKGGAVLGANCVGTFMLAEAGLLDDQPATTTWWLAERFAELYPRVRLDATALLTSNGAVITSGAAMSYLDLALHLVERFGGSELARACAKILVLDQGRRSQAAYAIAEHARTQDELVQRAIVELESNLAQGPSVDSLAKRVGVTTRTLTRRFRRAVGCTPLAYRSRIRMDAARQLLEQPNQSVDEVARAVGYADPSAFYRAFVRALGLPPRDYQRRFGITPPRGPRE